MRTASLYARLGLSCFVSLAIVLVLSRVYLERTFSRGLERRLDGELAVYLDQIAGVMEFTEDGRLLTPQGLMDPRFAHAYSGLYWQIDDPEMNDQLRSRSLWDVSLDLPADIHELGTVHRYRMRGPDQQPLIVQERALMVATPSGARVIRVSAAQSLEQLNAAITQFRADLWPWMLGLTGLLLLLSHLHLRWGLRPLMKLPADVNRLGQRANARLSDQVPVEVRPLTQAVNLLLDQQEVALQSARQRSADFAHGLKTPLSTMLNRIRKLGGNDPAAANELESLFGQLEKRVHRELALQQVALTPAFRRADADINTCSEGLIRTLQRTPNGERLDWHVSLCTGTTTVPVDPDDLAELLGNLLENAVKWTQTAVWISCSVNSRQLLWCLEDDGPGIPPEHIELMLDRGVRFDQTVSGNGIGLAIAREIADRYGIGMHIQNRQQRGLRIELRLPLVQPD